MMKHKIFRLWKPAVLLTALLALTSCADAREDELTYTTTDETTAVVHIDAPIREPEEEADTTTERNGAEMTYVTTEPQIVRVHYGTSGEPSTVETPAPVMTVEPPEAYLDPNGNMRAMAADGAEAYVAETKVYYWDNEALYLMGSDGEILSVPYSGRFPFMFYTAVMSEAQPSDLQTGTCVRIEYIDGTPKEIFDQRQYGKIVSLRIVPKPESAVNQFGVVKEVEDDRLLVYPGRCDDISRVDPKDCIYVPTQSLPIAAQDSFDMSQVLERGVEVGDYVQVHHSGEIRTAEPRQYAEVYCVKVHKHVAKRQFTVTAVRGSSLLIHSDSPYADISLGFSVFRAGYVFENGEPVSAESIRIGDVIEVEWSGTTLASYPGQFADFYVARIISRSTNS